MENQLIERELRLDLPNLLRVSLDYFSLGTYLSRGTVKGKIGIAVLLINFTKFSKVIK
jgi:hypothetical protein